MVERIFPPQPTVVKSNDKDPISTEDNYMITQNFEIGFDGELDIIWNVVSVLRIKSDMITEVTEEEDDFLAK